MDLRVILGNQFFDVGETNNWVLQLKNLLVQSDWNLYENIPVWGSTEERKSCLNKKS